MSKMNFSNKYKVLRVLDNKYSIVMSENDIRKSIRLLFRTQVSYLNINNLKLVFGRNVYESWCKHLTDELTRAYDLSNHIKVPIKRRSDNHSSNIKCFDGKFSVISTLRNPIKLKIFNCFHRHSIESLVYQGSAIEVIIPDNCFIMFHCGLVHCETPSSFICNGQFSSNTRLFFTIVEKTITYTMNILIKLRHIFVIWINMMIVRKNV